MASRVKKRTDFAAPPRGQQTLARRNNEKLTTGFYLFLAFFIPFILMFITFALAKVSPFGKNQILATDLWHQYYPFLCDYHEKLQTGGSLLWTWKSGGGTNYPALMAYYTASPLNLLSVFFPASLLREFVYVETCVKIGLAGLFFALFLRITFKRRDVAITAFGVMYALCAFIMGYYWNIIWLDTIALLPLVIAGTFALLRHGKFRLYIIALAISLLANYYIALFTCIFVALVSIGYTIVEWKGWRRAVRDFFKMAGCSLVSVLISAVLILPTYFALQSTHSSNNSFPKTFTVNMGGTFDFGGVLSGLGKTISNTIAFVQPTAKEGLPNVYCGVFTIFLAILFLFCSRIKKRERFYCLGLLLFFMLSFVIRYLDYIWHGFHFPNMLPHRFSFLFSFVLLYMAFRVFQQIDTIRPVAVIAAIAGFIIYLGIAYRYYTEGGSTLSSLYTSGEGGSDPNPVILSGFFGLLMALWVLLYSLRAYLKRPVQAICSSVIGVASTVFLILSADTFMAPLLKENAAEGTTGFTVAVIVIMVLVIAAVFIALYSKKLNAENRALKEMLSIVMIALALTEGLFSAAAGVKAVSVTDSSWYPLGTTDTLSLVDTIKEREKDTVDLYRTEVNKYYTLNDPTLIGVNGVSMFSSMANSKLTGYMEKFGICGWVESNRFTYQESSPFTNLMLNIKYLIAPYGNHLDKTNMASVATSGNVRLMQNLYYLPMGFMVNSNLLEYDTETLSRTDPIANQNRFFRLATGIDADLYEDIETNTVSESSISATAPREGIAVAYVTPSSKEAYSITLTNASGSMTQYVQRPFIMMMGSVQAGDPLTVSASNGSITGRFALMDEELFARARNLFARSTLNAFKVTETAVCGNINAVEDGLFYTSIPYSKGWTAYVDGEKVEITPVGNALIAFPLSKGAHIVELHYMPEGFVVGLAATILGVLILILMIILSWKKINLLDRYVLRKSAAGAATAVSAESGAAAEELSDVEVPEEMPDKPLNAPDEPEAPDDPGVPGDTDPIEEEAPETNEDINHILASLSDQKETE